MSLVTSSLSLTHRDKQNKGQAGREEITNEKGRRQSDKSKIRRKKEQREREREMKAERQTQKWMKIVKY